MLRARIVHRYKRQVNIGGGHTRKVYLSLFGSLFNTLHCHLIAREVNALLCLKGVYNVVHNALIKVIAAESVVTCGCKNLLNAVAHFDYGNIESAAAEVVNHNLLVVFLINAVSQCRSGRLIYNTFNLKSRNFACVLCCLALCVGEVCRNGDNRF